MTSNKDIRNLLNRILETLSNEEGLRQKDLITATLDAFPDLGTRLKTANKINAVLKQKEFVNRFIKIPGRGGNYIVRNQYVIGG